MQIKTMIEIELLPNNDIRALAPNAQQQVMSIWKHFQNKPEEILKDIENSVNGDGDNSELNFTFKLLE